MLPAIAKNTQQNGKRYRLVHRRMELYQTLETISSLICLFNSFSFALLKRFLKPILIGRFLKMMEQHFTLENLFLLKLDDDIGSEQSWYNHTHRTIAVL